MKKPTQNFLRLAGVLMLLLMFGALFYLSARKPPESDEITLADSETREAWLNLRGWRVDEPEITEIRMPQVWQTEAGINWLSLQNAQGLHPERYAGCDAVRYLYPVLNGANAYYCAELLLCGDVLVGAQIYDASTQLMMAVR